MLATPKIAIKLIGEANYEKYVSKKDKTSANTSGWNFGGAVGAGVDFAVTDRIILGVGAKYKLAPTDVKATTYTDKDGKTETITGDNNKVTYTGNTVEIFAELAFRITQN
jgi:opacity protein-like surface antigen